MSIYDNNVKVDAAGNVTIAGDLTVEGATTTAVTVDGETLSIDGANNRVGVGTTSPQVSLDVIGIGSFAGAEASLSQGNVQVGVDSGGDPGGELMYHTDDYVGLRCADSGTVSLAVKPDGKVGVGTTDPAQVLDVIGTGSFALAESSLSQGNVQVGVDSGGDPGGELMYHTDDYVGLRCADSGALSLAVKPSGNVGIGDVDPGTTLQLSSTTTALTLKNTTEENTDGGCESKMIFEDHDNNALGQIEVSHSGSSDDEKGKLILSTNNDSGLQAALTIDDTQAATFAGSVLAAKDILIESGPADTVYSGITANFIAGEALEVGECAYLKSDGKMWKAVADSAAATTRCVAMCCVDTAPDASGPFLLQGFLRADTNFPTWTVGGVLYTPEAEYNNGDHTVNVPEQTAPADSGDFVQVIGFAMDANTVYFDPGSTIVEIA